MTERDFLDRATLTARRDVVHERLVEAMRLVERCSGALAILDELLALPDPIPAVNGRPVEGA